MFMLYERKYVGYWHTKKQQREKEHIKDLFCLHCSCITKNIEVRYCDSYDEIYEFAQKKRENYYTDNIERQVV